jgi:hypothetical protein
MRELYIHRVFTFGFTTKVRSREVPRYIAGKLPTTFFTKISDQPIFRLLRHSHFRILSCNERHRLTTERIVTTSCPDITIRLLFPKLFNANELYEFVAAIFSDSLSTLKYSCKVFKDLSKGVHILLENHDFVTIGDQQLIAIRLDRLQKVKRRI